MNGIEVGKDVICIREHHDLEYKIGEIYRCYGLRQSKCKCGDTMIDIGIVNEYESTIYCNGCNEEFDYKDSVGWRDADDFAPLADISELEKLLKENIYENSENNTTR